MATTQRISTEMADKRINTKVALLERENQYNGSLLERIDKKIDRIEVKIERVESRIYNNFKWFLGISLSGVTAVASMGFAIYQYVKH